MRFDGYQKGWNSSVDSRSDEVQFEGNHSLQVSVESYRTSSSSDKVEGNHSPRVRFDGYTKGWSWSEVSSSD